MFLVFVLGTVMILAIGFFLLSWMSQVTNVTGYSVLGLKCDGGNCGGVNAGILGLVILALITLQYFLYKHYHKKREEIS